MNRRMSWLTLILAAALLVALQSRTQPVDRAATTSSLNLLSVADDQFYNYDFTSRQVDPSGVDWPVDLFFANNADINKVKSALNSYYPYGGSSMYLDLNHGSGLVWDSDGGKKSSWYPFFGQAVHYPSCRIILVTERRGVAS